MDQNKWSGVGEVIKKKRTEIIDPRGNYHVTDMTISCLRKVKGLTKDTHIPVECWQTMSDACDDIQIGDMVEIEGRFENKTWKNKEGVKQSKNLIVIERIKLVNE